MARLWRDRLLNILMPRVCAQCREDIAFPLSGPLCGACLALLHPADGPVCRRCALPVREGRSHCRLCERRIFALDCVRAAFFYRPPLPSLLYAFKYRKRMEIGSILAGWMAGIYPRMREPARMDAVVPVPLHPDRLRERGFNQAAVLAERVARAAGMPLMDALVRVRDTKPQWRLTRRDRSENLRGAFRPSPGQNVLGMSLLLVDDVCTTGGTLEECALALQEAGARELKAFVLARD